MALDPQRNHLLLVMDDVVASTTLSERLSSGDMAGAVEVTRAASLAEAAAALEVADFDLILLDLDLPDAADVDAYGQVASVAKFAPIVVLTDAAEDGREPAALRAGAQDVLPKRAIDRADVPRVVRFATERGRVLAGRMAFCAVGPVARVVGGRVGRHRTAGAVRGRRQGVGRRVGGTADGGGRVGPRRHGAAWRSGVGRRPAGLGDRTPG